MTERRPPFTVSRQRPEKGKLRGKKRRLRCELQRARDQASQLHCEPGDWWDFHHWHVDWRGAGNLGWGLRRRYFEALLVIFRQIAEIQTQFEVPFQSWIHLSGRDAGEDAVYLHTANPHETPFPIPDAGFEWGDGSELGEIDLGKVAPEFEWRVGWCRSEDPHADPPGLRTSATLYAVGLGVPLEATRR